MGWEKIFYNETNYVDIKFESAQPVNEEFNIVIKILGVIASIIILASTIPAFLKLFINRRLNINFVDYLVACDCLFALLYIPLILLDTHQYENNWIN